MCIRTAGMFHLYSLWPICAHVAKCARTTNHERLRYKHVISPLVLVNEDKNLDYDEQRIAGVNEDRFSAFLRSQFLTTG